MSCLLVWQVWEVWQVRLTFIRKLEHNNRGGYVIAANVAFRFNFEKWRSHLLRPWLNEENMYSLTFSSGKWQWRHCYKVSRDQRIFLWLRRNFFSKGWEGSIGYRMDIGIRNRMLGKRNLSLWLFISVTCELWLCPSLPFCPANTGNDDSYEVDEISQTYVMT